MFSYNDRGRMMATTSGSTDYLYNALGQMIEKSGTLGTTVFMQDETGHLIGEYDGSGNLIEETDWLGDIPVATLQPNGSGGVNLFYVHTDHLNAPRKIAQPTTGTLAWRWDVDPFGTAAPNQNPAGLGSFVYDLRFPGQYYMAETGLSQNWSRDYDPLTGKYVEPDPLGLMAGINLYLYVSADPVKLVDPTGLLPAIEEPEPWPDYDVSSIACKAARPDSEVHHCENRCQCVLEAKLVLCRGNIACQIIERHKKYACQVKCVESASCPISRGSIHYASNNNFPWR